VEVQAVPVRFAAPTSPSTSAKSVALKAGAGLVLVGIVGVSLIVPVGIIILLLRKK